MHVCHHVYTHRDGGSSAARSCNLSSTSLSTTLLAMGVALQKHTKQPHTRTPHSKCGTKHTSHPPLHGPTPQVVHQWPPPSYPWLVRRAQVISVFCSSSSTQGKMLVWLMAKPIRAFMTSSMNSSISWWVCWFPTRKTPGKGGGWGQTPPSPCIDGG